MKRFWNWARDADESRTLYLDGVIAEDSWFEDDVTPAEFKADLVSGSGPITIWINSPGGDCVAAAQIYNMLMEYPGDVTVKIDGIAASAASVIAMAGTRVLMSPTSLMMIHNPLTIAMGDSEEMRKAIQLLDEVKESIINAYEIKAQEKVIKNAARYLTGAAQAGASMSSTYDNRRTYHQDQSVSVQVDKLYVRDEKDVRSLAIELAQFNKTQYAGMGVR